MIEHVFFDLDRTLWDFESNSKIVLSELNSQFEIDKKCSVNLHEFIEMYWQVNDVLWEKYRQGIITKEELRSSRFYETMLCFGYKDEQLSQQLEQAYIHRSPYQKILVQDCLEVLDYLKEKYTLHVITNGFKEVQHIKLTNCGLSNYFDEVIISEEYGWNKPDVRIFRQAQINTGALPKECIMIGDDLHVDVLGAINAGMEAIYYNPKANTHKEKLNYEIVSLLQLKQIL